MIKRLLVIILFVIAGASLAARPVEAKVIDEHIFLIRAGAVDEKVLKAIKEKLPDSLPMTVKVEMMEPRDIPESAYDPSRQQYNAEMILDAIARKVTLDVRVECALIIVDVDLYSQDLNFVFGVANKAKSMAIISLARLRNEFYGLKPDNSLFIKRAVKEAVHELGHVWGLAHCSNPKCVMSFSNSLTDTDKKKSTFCHECQKKLGKRYMTPFFKATLF
ncbi:MAG: archaemetzincin family Zn-dependent metalloprotease [Candidatus Omnitrophica bacterium]|nr:archaemetzincin family Zn-dependent metalloprotease [Candidatus Omnitrophota bacterium]